MHFYIGEPGLWIRLTINLSHTGFCQFITCYFKHNVISALITPHTRDELLLICYCKKLGDSKGTAEYIVIIVAFILSLQQATTDGLHYRYFTCHFSSYYETKIQLNQVTKVHS